jgi:uncharacterized membrane protein (DUF4010 family)
MEQLGLDPLVLATGVALGIGLLIGVERERSKGVGDEREIAGVRTFTLVSLLGLLANVLEQPLALAVLGAAVAAIAFAGYLKSTGVDIGITTEVALLATFALGALSLEHPTYSAGVAVILTILLAARAWLHKVVKERLSDREMQDGLLLLAAALVVLPLLPDRTLDPLDSINPRRLWYVVVLVMSLSAIAYIALRLLGPRKGLALAGVLGGFISSVSTHAAMGQRASAQASLTLNAVAAAHFSSVATATLLIIVLSAVHAPLAMQVLWPAFAAASVSALFAVVFMRKSHSTETTDLSLGRPLSLRSGLLFGLVLGIVLFTSAFLAKELGPRGAVAAIAAAGFADAHSAAISAGLMRQREVISAEVAQLAVLLAFTTNALVKIVVSWAAGPRAYATSVTIGVIFSVASAWLVWWVFARMFA